MKKNIQNWNSRANKKRVRNRRYSIKDSLFVLKIGDATGVIAWMKSSEAYCKRDGDGKERKDSSCDLEFFIFNIEEASTVTAAATYWIIPIENFNYYGV